MPAALEPLVPLDLEDLAALRELTAPDDPRPLPRRALDARRSGSDAPARPARPGSVSRARVASLAAGAAAAGLVCGLVGPGPAALAQPLASAVRGTLFPASAPDESRSQRPATATATAAPTTRAASPRSAASQEAVHEQAQPSSPVEAIAAVARLIPAGLGPIEPVTPRPGATAAPVGWVPTRSLPRSSGEGRRIVYAETAAHVWVVGADGTVLRDYKVTGRPGRPKPGTYRVFSKSTTAVNPGEKLRFDLMVRFTHGVTGAAIGFHTIPTSFAGVPIQRVADLGRAIGSGGCIRQKRVDARWLYRWVKVGDRVVVLR